MNENQGSAPIKATDEEVKRLAAQIARDIFSAGDASGFGGPTQRIQFMGGQCPGKEIPMGGYGEPALTKAIERSIRAHIVRAAANMGEQTK